MSGPWLAFERRWRDQLAAAILPGSGQLPGMAQIDAEHAWRRLLGAAPPTFVTAVRAAVWLLTLCPPLVVGRLRPFGRLQAGEQDLVLARAQASRWPAVRLLTSALCAATLLCYFTDPGVDLAARTGGSDE